MSKHLPCDPCRRSFLKQLGALQLAALLPVSGSAKTVPVTKAAVKNRAPLAPNAFYLFPLGAIEPHGWIKSQLQLQADSLGGHLDETWADVGPNSGWLGGTGEAWERGPYFLDGLLPLAHLLGDARLKAKAQKYIDWTLDHPWPNGMIGPRTNDDWWPRMVMLKVLTQYQEASGDPRVVPFLTRYFSFQLNELPKRPLRDWGKFRWQDEVLSAIWLYNRTGDPKLIELASLLHQQGHDWPAQFRNFTYTQPITAEYLKLSEEGNGLKDLALSTHGVNNAQAIKTGPVWSMVSGSAADRHAVLEMIGKLDQYHGLPNGMFSCDEHLAGRNPSQGSELCSVVEYMFSLEQSLAILGDASLGDKLERLAYNALPGAFTNDMWAHQYNQEPNQVECSLHHKPWTTDGPESNLYGLAPHFGCCAANFHQGLPKFAASLFMLSHDDGLVAAAYAPCELHTVLRDTPLHVIEETEYPFRGKVTLTVKVASPLNFPLLLRIPAWAEGASIQVNGQAQPAPIADSFAHVERTWKDGDRVILTLPMQPRVSRWFNDSAAIERGPLVFSYPIGEGWLKLRDRGLTADWQVYPTTQWNYALSFGGQPPEQNIAVSQSDVGDHPFNANETPVKLKAKARKLLTWRAEDGVANPVPQSPVSSDEPEETISLIPYAAAKLRITAFPEIKSERASAQ